MTRVAAQPLAAGVVAAVFVDGREVKTWPVGQKEVTVEVEVGKKRLIEVLRVRPVPGTIASFVEQVEAKKPLTLKVVPN